MRVDQKYPLRAKNQRELEKQAWLEHEEERKRKYHEFLQKKKHGDDSGRYNEAISAKTKMQREYEAAKKAAQKGQAGSSAKPAGKKPSTAHQPETRQKSHQSGNGSAVVDVLGDTAPKFNRDYVTLTKEQLKILLDAAEGAKSASVPAEEKRGYANSRQEDGPIKSAEHKREGYDDHVIAVASPVQDQTVPTENRNAALQAASLAERKRQQWAEEKEELGDYLKEAAASLAQKAVDHNKDIPLPNDSKAKNAFVSEMLSESLREKKLRQWREEHRLANEAKGSLAEIGQHPEERPGNRYKPKPEVETNLANFRADQGAHKKVSLVEKKKQQWEKEKGITKEGSVIGEWFGKPGAGAPIRADGGEVLTQYGVRAGDARSLQDTLAKTYGINLPQKKADASVTVVAPDFHTLMAASKESPRGAAIVVEAGRVPDNEVPPPAMRSAFTLGTGTAGVAPDDHRYDNVKERERQAWLDDLQRQIEEKKAQKAKEQQSLDAYYRDEPVQDHAEMSKPSGKQMVQVEYEKKRPVEQHDTKKEAASNAERLHHALAQAEMEAQRNKLLRRIEKLRQGGHDTRGLEKTYKELLTPRPQAVSVPIAVAGLDNDNPPAVQHQSTRILTPTERRTARQPAGEPVYHDYHDSQGDTGRESCGVQTEDFVFASGKRLRDILRENSKVEVEYRDNKMAMRNGPAGKKQHQIAAKMQQQAKDRRPPVKQEKREEKKVPEHRGQKGEKKPWQYQNMKNRPALKASEREVGIGSAEKSERDRRRKERAMHLIALADMNMAKSRLLPSENHGRLVPAHGHDNERVQRPRSRSNQRPPVYGDTTNRSGRHVSPPADMSSSRNPNTGRNNMALPPRHQQAEAEFLPYRRSSARLERGEIPANYDNMIDASSNFDKNSEKGQLMRQHLHYLKEGLLRRQQELERSMTPNTLLEVRMSQQYRQTENVA